MKVLDLFSGTGAATAPWSRAGHDVIRVELEDGHDARAIASCPGCVLIWASPPCQEYSLARAGNRERRPDLSLWQHALNIIHASRPLYWIIENVCGAQRFWGRPKYHYGPFYLWGFYPPFIIRKKPPRKMDYHTARDRARVPRELAAAVFEAIVTDMTIRRLR